MNMEIKLNYFKFKIMRKLLLVLIIWLPMVAWSQGSKKPPEMPAASSIGSADLWILWQSGGMKKLENSYLSGMINDTADVLRAEFPPLWINDIHDTADVIRQEIDDLGTADTAFSRTAPNVTRLKYIGLHTAEYKN